MFFFQRRRNRERKVIDSDILSFPFIYVFLFSLFFLSFLFCLSVFDIFCCRSLLSSRFFLLPCPSFPDVFCPWLAFPFLFFPSFLSFLFLSFLFVPFLFCCPFFRVHSCFFNMFFFHFVPFCPFFIFSLFFLVFPFLPYFPS